MEIKAAIFDMDGTLVDSLVFWDSFWSEFGKKYLGDENFKPAAELDKRVRTTIFNDALACIKEYVDVDATVEELIAFGNAGVVDFYKYSVPPKVGAHKLLDYLREQGIKICIATATERRYVSVAMEACDLNARVDAVFSCHDIGVSKDRPDIYLLAQKHFGFSVDEICVFEDSYVALETAKAAGFKTVGIYDKYNFEQERLAASADMYICEGQGLDSVIPYICLKA